MMKGLTGLQDSFVKLFNAF